MALPISFLTPGRTVRLRVDGEDHTGSVIACANDWLRLSGADGDILVNLAQVAWIVGLGDAPPVDAALPKPKPQHAVALHGTKAPGRPWTDETVQAIVRGFLDDQGDAELAAIHGRTRSQVTILHQAWECARGNIPDDRLSPAAQLWVERIRRAMRPE